MSRRLPEPRIYKHQGLMDRLNTMMILVKMHLAELPKISAEHNRRLLYPRPGVRELDRLMNDIMEVLKQDSQPMIKRKCISDKDIGPFTNCSIYRTACDDNPHNELRCKNMNCEYFKYGVNDYDSFGEIK